MAQSILVFDFGTNEEAAQQARHKIEAWRQGFRLGNKMLLKFERKEPSEGGAATASQGSAGNGEKVSTGAGKQGKKKSAAKGAAKGKKAGEEPGNSEVRLLVRLDFSDHEKLSHQRWLDRIPVEEPFKSTKSETFRSGDPEFSKTAEFFDSLD